jgi:hypothetical protein
MNEVKTFPINFLSNFSASDRTAFTKGFGGAADASNAEDVFGPGFLSRGSQCSQRPFGAQTLRRLLNRPAIPDVEPAKSLASSHLNVPNWARPAAAASVAVLECVQVEAQA